MVATADGKVTLEGRAGGIGNEDDRELFRHLRTQADAVMVGAGTARVERYGRIGRNPELADKRRREGLRPAPLACIVSGSLDVAADLPIMADPRSRLLLVTASDRTIEGAAAELSYLRVPGSTPGSVDLGAALRSLRSEHDVRSVLCEGGPTLNAALLEQGLVDELFLSLAPKLTGGLGLTAVAGAALQRPVELELISAHEADSFLFLRYRVRR